MTIREILVDWQTINGGGKVSVFNFNATETPAAQRLALSNFLAASKAVQHASTSYTIRKSGKEMNEGTGELTGAWNASVDYTGIGAISAGQMEADAVQVLVQWRTSEVINGRFLRGRTFLPGIAQGALVNGNLGASSVALISSAGNTLCGTTAALSVWRRPHESTVADPRPSYVGFAAAAEACTVWSELAVLRRRRG